jgi:chaperonin GroEL (HSP60 family)
MLNNFLNLYKPINIVIQNSNNKAFKDKKLLISDKELLYLKNTLLILKIFIKAKNKLQANKYPTIYYTLLLLYSIYI